MLIGMQTRKLTQWTWKPLLWNEILRKKTYEEEKIDEKWFLFERRNTRNSCKEKNYEDMLMLKKEKA